MWYEVFTWKQKIAFPTNIICIILCKKLQYFKSYIIQNNGWFSHPDYSTKIGYLRKWNKELSNRGAQSPELQKGFDLLFFIFINVQININIYKIYELLWERLSIKIVPKLYQETTFFLWCWSRNRKKVNLYKWAIIFHYISLSVKI